MMLLLESYRLVSIDVLWIITFRDLRESFWGAIFPPIKRFFHGQSTDHNLIDLILVLEILSKSLMHASSHI